MSLPREIPGTVRLFAENGELLQTDVELIPKTTCIIFYTFAAAVSASSLYSIYPPLAEASRLTLDQLNIGIGYSYWSIGFSTCILQPCAIAFGKRPVFIFSSLSGACLFIWTIYVSMNATWIISRLLVGFTSGPCFALAETTITDVFFLHQRGFPLGLYVFVLYIGALVGPLLIIIRSAKGWRESGENYYRKVINW